MIFHGSNKHVSIFLILQFVAVKVANNSIFIALSPVIALLTDIPLVLPYIVPAF